VSEQRLAPGERARIVRDSLGVGVATGAYGVSFGAVSVASGLSVAQTCALSLVMFTGASQFAFVGVLAAGGAPVSGALTALLLGTRNTLYGLRLAPLLGWRGLRRLLAAQVLIDESTAMSVTRPTTAAARVGFLATGVSIFVLWNATTLVGALLGDAIGDPRTYGLDAAAAAAFCALLWPRLKSADAFAIAGLAAVIAVVVAPHAPAGVPVLVAASAALLAAVWPKAHHDPLPPHHWDDEVSHEGRQP